MGLCTVCETLADIAVHSMGKKESAFQTVAYKLQFAHLIFNSISQYLILSANTDVNRLKNITGE